MSLGFSAQRGLHEVYAASHNASVKRLASNDVLRVYAIGWRTTLEAIDLESAISVKFWAYRSASSFKEAANFPVYDRTQLACLRRVPIWNTV